MTYPEILHYLYSQLPMFTRDGASAYKEDLTNTIELCKRLGNPQQQFKSIHVGGTNGKGSTSHMLAAILQTAGYKTGLYTSPHLVDFRERVRVNGMMISEQQVVDFVEHHKSDFEDIQPSFFEMTVGLAFDRFAKEQVDIAVIEVGLGGRLDSTNIITPLMSVITNIGWDHMNILGNTLQLIAAEKAGIIKPNVPVIIGEYQSEVAKIFVDKAKQENAPISFASEEWDIEDWRLEKGDQRLEAGDERSEIRNRRSGDIDTNSSQYLNVKVIPQHSPPDSYRATTHNSPLTTHHSPLTTHRLNLDLTGTYQLKNVKTVLTAVNELRFQGFIITDDHIKTALDQVKLLTGLHGRWETLSTNPFTICDTGHNPEGIAEVLKNIANVRYEHLHFVIGVVNDKDISKILQMLPAVATYYFCKPSITRGLDAENLKRQAANAGLKGSSYSSVKEAFKAAQYQAGKSDLVFIGGSTFVVAEVIER